MASLYLLLLMLSVLACSYHELEACRHHLMDVEDDFHYDESLNSNRRKRQLLTNDETSKLTNFFTGCMDFRLSNLGYDWRSNVDFSVWDSIWYHNADQTFCIGDDTQECWRDELEKFVNNDHGVLVAAQGCVEEFTERITSQAGGNGRKKRAIRRNANTFFGFNELPRYSTCLDRRVFFRVNRPNLNFEKLAFFIEENTVDCDVPRRSRRRRRTITWPYRLIALTRADSPLRTPLNTCATQVFPLPPYFDNWGSWSTCSASCGPGTQVRRRTCWSGANPRQQSQACVGNNIERRSCHIEDCQNRYRWGSWSSFSDCTVTCGGGTQFRTRRCLRGDFTPVSERFCRRLGGQARDTRKCNEFDCPSIPSIFAWTSWSGYTNCRQRGRCGRGTQTRSRRCLFDNNIQVSSRQCPGLDTETRSCIASCGA